MFEEKIKLNPIKIDNVVEKDIYGQKVKFNRLINQEEVIFIINQCVDRFNEVNNKKKNLIVSMNEAIRTMNICLCYLATNIEMNNIAYDDLCAMGIFKNIEEILINYNEIKTNVISSITLMFDYVVYNAIEQLPNSKQMIENLSEMKEIFTSNPKKAKEFANIVIANHPELQGFGEIFEKFLNNLNKKE